MSDSRRDLFSLPDGVHYLNCAFMSPLPVPVADAGRAAIDEMAAPLDLTPEDFFRDSDRVRRLFARVLGGADPDGVALVPAVSYGAAVVAANLDVGHDEKVVISSGQFPSNVYPWRRLADRCGAQVRVVERPVGGARAGSGWTERVLEAVGPDTGLVALPQAHWTDGALFDLAAVGRRCRDVGAAFVVDGTQTVGAHPFAVEDVEPDAVLCAGYKWLLGPYSVGCAWLGPRLRDGVPLEETWIGRVGSEDFSALVDYADAYRGDASRFDVGERSNFILVPMLAAALELILDVGPGEIAEHCSRLTAGVAEGARARGFAASPDGSRASNIVGLGVPDDVEPPALECELERRRIHVSRRGDALRVSPHLYNDGSDVEAFLAALDAAR